METILIWVGISLAFFGLLWLAGRFVRQPTQVEPYDGYNTPSRLMLVIEELDQPTVMGYFQSAEQAQLRAFKIITGNEFSDDGRWATVADWFSVTPGVHVTSLVSASTELQPA